MNADTSVYSPPPSPCDQATPLGDYLAQGLEDLCCHLPLDVAWGITREIEGTRRLEVIKTRPWSPVAAATLATETAWSLPPEPLTVVSLDIPEAAWVYGCRFSLTPTAPPEYLLVGASQPLDRLQQFCLRQQALLLHQWRSCQQRLTDWSQRLQQLTQETRQARHQLVSALAAADLQAALLEQQLGGHLQATAQALRQALAEANTYLEEMAARSQGRSLQLQRWPVNDLLQQCRDELRPWLEQRQLRIECPDTPIELTFDRWQLQQVLKNVLTNAAQFSPDGATITCHWQVFQREVLLQITDQGPGLSAADQANLFNPFYSRRQGGTGLGLAIAAQIIHAHRGRIWAHNLPQGGTQICISLPRFF